MELLSDLYWYIIVRGLPFIVLLLGFILIQAQISKRIGIFFCILCPIMLLSMASPELYVLGVIPVTSMCIGVFLVILGIRLIKRRRSYIPFSTALIITGVFFASYVPIQEAVISPYQMERAEAEQGQYELDYPIWNAVSLAAASGNTRELEILLESGVNLDDTIDGVPLLKKILITTYDPRERKTVIKIIQLLLDAGYDGLVKDENGATLLMYAAIDPRWPSYAGKYSDEFAYELTELFIDYGVDVNEKDSFGRTALMWACNYRGRGADYTIDIETKPFFSNDDEYFPESYPVFNYKQIKCLIDNGADVNAQDNNGFRALDYFNFTVNENSKRDGIKALELYTSAEYLETIKAIEELLRVE